MIECAEIEAGFVLASLVFSKNCVRRLVGAQVRKGLAVREYPLSCTCWNNSPNCSDGGTFDAQGGICADAEPALMAPHRTAIIVIKRDPARSSNGKRPRTMMSVFAEDADIERSHVFEPFVVPSTERFLALWPASLWRALSSTCSC